MLEQSLNLARESENVPGSGVIQRLFAKAVPRQKQLAAHAVQNGEGEHAVESARQVLSPGLIAMDQDFRIRMTGMETVAFPFELGTQLGMIVDFAVVGDPDRARCIRHRLLSAGDVQNREAAMTEMNRILGIV